MVNDPTPRNNCEYREGESAKSLKLLVSGICSYSHKLVMPAPDIANEANFISYIVLFTWSAVKWMRNG
jgi:hypothetical protein